MLALSSSSEAGNRLRAKRERRHLSIRDVERFSQRIVEEKKNPAYYVPHNWVSDLENGKSKPRLEKFHSLSLIYKCDINEILALFGLNIGDLDKEQGLIALPYTHLSGRAISRAEPMVPTSLKLQDKVLLEQTNLVHRMFQGLGEMPLFLVQHAGVRDVLYGYVGTEDYTLDPLIRPGAFVQIDPHQNKVTKGIWRHLAERIRPSGVLCRASRQSLRLRLVRLRRKPLTGCPVPKIASGHPVLSLSSRCRDRWSRHRVCDANCGAAHRYFGHAFSGTNHTLSARILKAIGCV